MKKTITKAILMSSLAIFGLSNNSNAQWIGKNLNGKGVTSIASDGTTIFAGTSGYAYASTAEAKLGDIFVSTDNGNTWTEMDSGFGDTVKAVNNFLIAGNNVFTGTDKGVYLSTNNGGTWINKGLIDVQAFAISGGNLFAGTGSGVYLSTDNGSTWTITGLTDNIKAMATIGNALLAGTQSGVKKSTDNGTTWVYTGINNEGPNSFASIGSNIFVGCYGGLGGVRLSTDNGSTWAGANYSFTQNIKSLVSTGNSLLAGTQMSKVFLSSNNGTSWTDVSTGLPANSGINTFAISGGNVFVGTSNNSYADTTGNGVWMRPLSELGITTGIIDTQENENFSVYPNPTTGKFIIHSTITKGEISVYNLVGEEIYKSKVSSLQPTVDMSNQPKGIYFLKVYDGTNSYTKKIVVE